jgi:hypothetical protein
MDGAKLAQLGWSNRVAFADGLAATIDWFRANEVWWRAARSGDWDAYYDRQYAGRLANADAAAGAQPVAEPVAVPVDVAPGSAPADAGA